MCALAAILSLSQPAATASAGRGGLLSAVLSIAADEPDTVVRAGGPISRRLVLGPARPNYAGLSLDAELSSNFISAIPVVREIALNVLDKPQRKASLKRLAKYLPDGFEEDAAILEMSGSDSLALGWGEAIRFELGEDVIAEGIASSDTVRWIAGLRHGSEDQQGGYEYEIGVRAQLSAVQRGTVNVCVPIALPFDGRRGGIGVGLSILRGRNMYDGCLTGIAEKMPNGKGKLVGMLEKMEWDQTRGRALGYAIDIAGAVALSERVCVGACLRNAIGSITWEDVLFVEGIVNTDTVTVDENGYLVYAPTMTGVQHTEDWRQTLPRVLEAKLNADYGGVRVNAQMYCGSQRLLPAAAIEFDLGRIQSAADAGGADRRGRLPWLELGCRLTPALRATWYVRLHDQDERWGVLLGADGLGPGSAKALSASMRLAFEF